MTAIHNTRTGEWIYPEARPKAAGLSTHAPQFVRVLGQSPLTGHRRETIINIGQITKVEHHSDRCWVSVRGQREPVALYPGEYERLLDVLESSGQLLTLREDGSE